MKDGKAAGVSGIVAEMLKVSGEAGSKILLKRRKCQVIGRCALPSTVLKGKVMLLSVEILGG